MAGTSLTLARVRTCDREDALDLADRVVIINHGIIEQD
jgi:ABC-type sulfate/molybdate transport systems ATPase subunit